MYFKLDLKKKNLGNIDLKLWIPRTEAWKIVHAWNEYYWIYF